MEKSFASFELEVLPYGLLTTKKTHPIFKSLSHFKKEGVLSFSFRLI
jgi:hypothetical protein